MVEQRHAQLEGGRHRGLVGLQEQVVAEPARGVGLQHAVQRMRAARSIEQAARRLGAPGEIGGTVGPIRSSALRLGESVKSGVALFYGGAIALWAAGFWLLRADWVALLTLIPVAAHLLWQVTTLDADDPANPLERFRSNRWAGALMAAACFVVGNAGA